MSFLDVLIVDDDEAIAEFVEETLADKGYRVQIAPNGQQALEVLGHTRPHMLLLDLMLPLMDGWELARAMHESPSLKDVPIVVMSAHNDVPEEAQAIGAAGFLLKPFELDDLLSCVATFAGDKH